MFGSEDPEVVIDRIKQVAMNANEGRILRRYITESMRGLLREFGKGGYESARGAAKAKLDAAEQAWANAQSELQNAEIRLQHLQAYADGKLSRDKLRQMYGWSVGATAASEISKKIGTLMGNGPKSITWYDEQANKAGRAYKKAQEAYATYDPEQVFYRKRKIKYGEPKKPEGKRKGEDINKKAKLVWHRWPAKAKGIKFGRIGEIESGYGPGEDRLAKIFGARVQGGGVSFDLMMSDGTKWEVKGLSGPTDSIRPGTEGIGAYDKARGRLERIMRQIKGFANTATEMQLDVELENQKEAYIVRAVSDWIDDYYEKMVGRGEITQPDMHMFIKAVQLLQKLTVSRREDPDKVTGMEITLGGRKVTVDRQTFIDVAKRLRKYDDNIMDHIGALDIAVGHLTDPVFDASDASDFLDEWAKMVNVEDVFSQVDGVIIVNEKMGYNIIPKDRLKDVLEFDQVTQGKPRFRFKRF
jgi:hypothetical protein